MSDQWFPTGWLRPTVGSQALTLVRLNLRCPTHSSLATCDEWLCLEMHRNLFALGIKIMNIKINIKYNNI